MQRFIYYLQRIGVWCWRIRQRRGYNIHSPFAFQLVKGVIYQRGRYYAYERLHQERKGQALPERDDRLLFRLANDSQPRTALFVGPDTADEQLYVAAACQKCTCYSAATTEEAVQQASKMGHIDFLFLNTSERTLHCLWHTPFALNTTSLVRMEENGSCTRHLRSLLVRVGLF